MNLKTIIPTLAFDYHISETGDVINTHTGKTLEIMLSNRGYRVVSLRDTGNKFKCKTYTIARLLALAFIQNPHHLPEVDHINGIKTDDRIENLRWCTSEDNLMWEHERVGRKYYRLEKINEFREMRKQNISWKKIAEYAEYSGSVLAFADMVKRRKK